MYLTKELLDTFAHEVAADPIHKAVAGAVARVGLEEAALNTEVARQHTHIFSTETKRGEMTNQKMSGRCWIFAALNAARVNTMKKLDIETVEFSQNYLFFWDKLEKANFFLENILETLDEPLTSRLMAHLLANPVQDGGQWDMFSGLLEKYGLVPKECMPETFHSSNSRVLLAVLTRRLRKHAQLLRSAHEEGVALHTLREKKEAFLSSIYSILVKALGRPPEKFDFVYKDKEKKFHKVRDLTPQKFFCDFVGWDLKNKVSLIHAPTADKPFGRTYTVKFLGTVKEAPCICYVNTPIEVLKEATASAIRAGEPVWFGCDVGQMMTRKDGIMDTEIFGYESMLGTTPEFNKAERLDYGESLLTHAMVITGFDEDAQGNPVRWQVENSWGDDTGKKGMFSMSDRWFDEYLYQITIDKKFVPQVWLDALEKPIIALEPWDPMGALADTPLYLKN
ncbi:bleomycin hydrolase [Treponema pallidum subsp. pertenue]|uniref:C1 family peptidase n=1 Tax=Treponema pallidum TaxID=160 RepID=UPI000BA619C8|nr:bleomycin hydrolase [Treponema pallidum subsp. pertenue]ASV58823.1 bleomycin hydrolase [Treponema pallidum subsp. pertenue]AZN65990.1 bleomycin hydrolase [Treponema pallidum subsp. pertenue]